MPCPTINVIKLIQLATCDDQLTEILRRSAALRNVGAWEAMREPGRLNIIRVLDPRTRPRPASQRRERCCYSPLIVRCPNVAAR